MTKIGYFSLLWRSLIISLNEKTSGVVLQFAFVQRVFYAVKFFLRVGYFARDHPRTDPTSNNHKLPLETL